MLASYQAQVPAAAAAYFGPGAEHPVVRQEFTPGRGWKTQGYRKRISRSWARKLRAEGVTHVALRSGSRVADFAVAELTR